MVGASSLSVSLWGIIDAPGREIIRSWRITYQHLSGQIDSSIAVDA